MPGKLSHHSRVAQLVFILVGAEPLTSPLRCGEVVGLGVQWGTVAQGL